MPDGVTPPPDDVAAEYRRLGYWRSDPLHEVVLRTADHDPARPAVCGPRPLTYGQLTTAARRAGAGLRSLGLQPADRLVVQLPNSVELLVTVLGALYAGIAPVLMVPALGTRELCHVVRTSGARGLVVRPGRNATEVTPAVRGLSADLPGLVAIAQASRKGSRVPERFVSLDDVLRSNGPLPERQQVGGDRVALYLLSGGTTGLPKVIARTHQDYVYNIERSAELAGVDADSCYLAALPLTHNFALGCPGVFGTLAAGGRVTFCEPTVPSMATAIERDGVTVTGMVPGMAVSLATSDADLSGVRVLQVGGAKLQPADARLVAASGPAAVQQVFGMAEGLLNFTRLDDPPEVVARTQGRPASPGDECLVVDEHDVPVPDGEPGELLVRGPYTIRSYLASAEVNAASFTADGYYRTGDVVRRDPSGNWVVSGRRRDFVNRGGEKIAADEVEEALAGHPALRATAVVPSPHAFFGETVCVVVVPAAGQTAPDLAELRQWLREYGLATFKLPERLLVLDALPLTAVGKTDRARLTALAAQPADATEPTDATDAAAEPTDAAAEPAAVPAH